MKRSIKIFLVLSALSFVATILPKYIERQKAFHKTNSVRSEQKRETKRNHQKPLMGVVKMSSLIEGFKKEHSEILEALKEVKELDVLSKEGRTKLMSIKATLLKHFKKEDEQFYPVLRKEAEQNTKLKEELEVFAKDLENASRYVFEFFDRCDKGLPEANLSRDFETLFMVIRDRMRNEENILYDEYDKRY